MEVVPGNVPADAVQYEILVTGAHKLDGKIQPGGGQIKLTDEAIQHIVELTANGNYMQTALAAAGFSKHVVKTWRHVAYAVMERYPDLAPDDYPEGYKPPYLTLHQWQAFKVISYLEQAEAKAEAYAVLTVRKHMPDQWAAAMTYLERRFPERWRKRQTVETVDGGQVVDGIDEDALIADPEALDHVHDALEALIQAQGRQQLPAGDLEVIDEVS